MTDRETILRRKRESAARMRDKRRAARLCITCRAGLQDADHELCIECTETHRETARRYRASAKGRATGAAAQRARYWLDPERHREEARLRRKLAAMAAEVSA